MKGLRQWFILGVLLTCGGCTNTQLRISTLDQGATLADIQYQMICAIWHASRQILRPFPGT